MKRFYVPIFLMFLFSGCKKNDTNEEKNGKCLLETVNVNFNNSSGWIASFEYDEKARLKTFIDDLSTSSYAYFKDSVVITTNANSRTTYFLNSQGLAITGKTAFPLSTDQSQIDHTFAYNAEGYLIRNMQILSRLYLGSVLKDTTIENFTIVNGNVVSLKTITPSVTFENQYEYSAAKMNTNNPFLNEFPSSHGSFLGKAPVNLVVKEKVKDGNTVGDMSYTYDAKGNIITKTVVNPYTTMFIEFHYRCD